MIICFCFSKDSQSKLTDPKNEHIFMCVGLNFHHLAFQSVLMFNIDPVTWKFFTRNNDVGFGYRVIERHI